MARKKTPEHVISRREVTQAIENVLLIASREPTSGVVIKRIVPDYLPCSTELANLMGDWSMTERMTMSEAQFILLQAALHLARILEDDPDAK